MRHLYFASCVPEGGIYHYSLADGRLSFLEKTPCDSPMYLHLEQDFLQVLLKAPFEGSAESGLVTYPLGENKTLGTPKPPINTKGVEACHLSRLWDKTYVANYSSGSIFSAEGIVRTHAGVGVHPTRQEAPHLHFVAPSPDEKCLLAVDLGLDAIYSYDENLQLLSKAHVPAGCGPRHLAYSADGQTVFCANELASSVTVFGYCDGKLTAGETVALPEHENPENTVAAIRVWGDYVYVSNRGEDTISCLKWDGDRLRLCSTTPCGGRSPRDFLLVDDLLFCTNERSDNVTIFSVDGPKLVQLEQQLQMPSPLCVVAG